MARTYPQAFKPGVLAREAGVRTRDLLVRQLP
ncbi:hypothetical protein J2Z30_006724 [Streptomyces iranensis]|uniref:Transposase n=1 Tax=Streptomyces iranensis TaxID=576784 RepID=A0ABS4N101_9ACTN|nr:hypothetical protein [Streptomyces iranensis]